MSGKTVVFNLILLFFLTKFSHDTKNQAKNYIWVINNEMGKFKDKYENNIGIKYSWNPRWNPTWNFLGIISGTCYIFIKNTQIYNKISNNNFDYNIYFFHNFLISYLIF